MLSTGLVNERKGSSGADAIISANGLAWPASFAILDLVINMNPHRGHMIKRLALLSASVFFVLNAHANVLGDMQTFAPNSDGLDFVTVHTSRPLTKGFFALGGHFSFAKDHLTVFKDMTTQEKYDYRDQLVEFDLDVAYALTDKLSVFFAAPTLLYQEAESGQDVDVNISKGVHTYRPGFKWTFGSGWRELAVIGSIDINNVTNSPYTGVDAEPIYNLEFAKTFRRAQAVNYGFNLGYRWHNPTAMPEDANMFPLDDQFTFSAGRSAPFLEKSRWVLEGIASLPMDKHPYKDTMHASSFDILVGFKHRLMRNLNFDWGGTVEPLVDSLSPRYRVFVGLVYCFSPGWSSNQDRETVPPPVAAAPINERAEEEAESEARKDSAFDPLVVSPELAEVFEGSLVRYEVSGGVGPYDYRLIEGKGRINVGGAYYRAPLFPETARIEISDTTGLVKVVKVIVRTAPKPNETIRIKNLNFKFNTDILVPQSEVEIDRLVKVFQKKKVSRIIVEGHTDSKGSDEYNMELSEKRAQAVRRIFIRDLGLDKDQVNAIGFGEERPIASNATEKGRLQNRRVDLKVYYR